MSAVPVIDIAAGADPARRRAVVEAVGEACREIGFLIISGTGIEDLTIDTAVRECHRFFTLDSSAKLAAARPDPTHIRGYSGIGSEALAQLEHDIVPPDLKELFDVGPENVPRDDPYYGSARAGASFAPNVWPPAAPMLRPALAAYFLAMQQLSKVLAHLFAEALALPTHYFDDKLDRHISILRANHYPPQRTAPQPHQLRAGAHTDYTAFTILWQQAVAGGGLQIRNRAGAWQDVPAAPGTMVVNIGDSLARWTNDAWVSTMHRVVNPPTAIAADSARLSLVYFCQPNYDAVIECLPSCTGPDQPPRYPPIANGAFLAMKFAEQQSSG